MLGAVLVHPDKKEVFPLCPEPIYKADGITKKESIELQFYNNIPLNDSNNDLLVNFINCVIRDKKGKVTHFSWFTDLLVTQDNVYSLARAGRARWHIENETFNTLKNQGYQF